MTHPMACPHKSWIHASGSGPLSECEWFVQTSRFPPSVRPDYGHYVATMVIMLHVIYMSLWWFTREQCRLVATCKVLPLAEYHLSSPSSFLPSTCKYGPCSSAQDGETGWSNNWTKPWDPWGWCYTYSTVDLAGHYLCSKEVAECRHVI